MTRVLAIIAALWCSQASAYLGTFDPVPYRNSATVTFLESQVAGIQCAAEAAKLSPVYALLSPTLVQLMSCAIIEPPTVITPSKFSIGSAYALHMLATKSALDGHELGHLFFKHLHPPLMPFLTGLPSAHCEGRRNLADQQQDGSVQSPERPDHFGKQLRLHSADETKCVIFIKDCSVDFAELGELVDACKRVH